VPALAVGASLPIILSAAAAGLFLATIWAAAVGQSAVATIFGVFAAFWLSYALLLLGLLHGWFGIGPLAVARTEEAFLITWIVVIGLLTLGTLRLPMAFTAILVLVEVALILVLIATYQSSSGILKAGGYVALAFAAVGAFAYLGAATRACGGRALPLGRPLWR
jgi:succinate-acetate transporter protein